MEITTENARAIVKAIWRNSPAFNNGGGEFGYDWRTMRPCYPETARILYAAMLAADAAERRP